MEEAEKFIAQLITDVVPEKWLTYLTKFTEWDQSDLVWFEFYKTLIKYHGYSIESINEEEMRDEWLQYIETRKDQIQGFMLKLTSVIHPENEKVSFWKWMSKIFYLQNYEPLVLPEKDTTLTIATENMAGKPYDYGPFIENVSDREWVAERLWREGKRKLLQHKDRRVLWGVTWQEDSIYKRNLMQYELRFSKEEENRSVFEEIWSIETGAFGNGWYDAVFHDEKILYFFTSRDVDSNTWLHAHEKSRVGNFFTQVAMRQLPNDLAINMENAKRFVLSDTMSWLLGGGNESWLLSYNVKTKSFFDLANVEKLVQNRLDTTSYDVVELDGNHVFMMPSKFKKGPIFSCLLTVDELGKVEAKTKMWPPVSATMGTTIYETISIHLPWLGRVLVSFKQNRDCYYLIDKDLNVECDLQSIYKENQLFLGTDYLRKQKPILLPIIMTIPGDQSGLGNFNRSPPLIGINDKPLYNGKDNGFQRHGLNMCFLNNLGHCIYKPYAYWSSEDRGKKRLGNLNISSMIVQFDEIKKEKDGWTILFIAGTIISVHPNLNKYFVRDILQ